MSFGRNATNTKNTKDPPPPPPPPHLSYLLFFCNAKCDPWVSDLHYSHRYYFYGFLFLFFFKLKKKILCLCKLDPQSGQIQACLLFNFLHHPYVEGSLCFCERFPVLDSAFKDSCVWQLLQKLPYEN